MIATRPPFTAAHSLVVPSDVVPAEACPCAFFQPGCRCYGFCRSSGSKAMRECNGHRDNNPECKMPGRFCSPCSRTKSGFQGDDRAQYHACPV